MKKQTAQELPLLLPEQIALIIESVPEALSFFYSEANTLQKEVDVKVEKLSEYILEILPNIIQKAQENILKTNAFGTLREDLEKDAEQTKNS